MVYKHNDSKHRDNIAYLELLNFLGCQTCPILLVQDIEIFGNRPETIHRSAKQKSSKLNGMTNKQTNTQEHQEGTQHT